MRGKGRLPLARRFFDQPVFLVGPAIKCGRELLDGPVEGFLIANRFHDLLGSSGVNRFVASAGAHRCCDRVGQGDDVIWSQIAKLDARLAETVAAASARNNQRHCRRGDPWRGIANQSRK